ncbi:hypothetical protein ACHAWF_003736 [Thalassiosira exigua]
MDDSPLALVVCGDDLSLASIVRGGLLRDPGIGPYRASVAVCHASALLTFVASTATGNWSQVDKLWSILPAAYAWTCIADRRTALMACLATAWSIRLTYNFRRRGGYSWPPWRGEEDHRWEVLRRGALGGPWRVLAREPARTLFNAAFVSLCQNYLLLYVATPSLVAWTMAARRVRCPTTGDGANNLDSSHSLNILDVVASTLFLLGIALEAAADNQQYDFQRKKREWTSGSRANAGKISADADRECADGFCQSGLFSIVRKPAYAGEQLIWISFYLFSVAAEYADEGAWRARMCWNWSGGGFASLCLLFQGSGWLTEEISASKYPKYRLYQKTVPLYVPCFSSLFGVDEHDNVRKE